MGRIARGRLKQGGDRTQARRGNPGEASPRFQKSAAGLAQPRLPQLPFAGPEPDAGPVIVEEFDSGLLQRGHHPDQCVGAGIDMPVRFFHLPQRPERNLAALREVSLGPAKKPARRP